MFPNSEAEYYFARERAARCMAANAKDPAAKASHLEMAAEYRRRAFACQKRIDESSSIAGSDARGHG
jgi:hypothetical protein